MSNFKKQVRETTARFVTTLRQVSELLKKNPAEITRDEYVRTAVDNKVEGRLNKEELNALGGYKGLRQSHFDAPIKQPKVLLFDIETAPITAYVWGLWDNNVSLDMIKSDWYVLSWSAKWLNDNEVMYDDQRNEKDIENDHRLLLGIWELLDEADIVITQNGKKFDVKKLNARFILHGFQPPSSYRHIDTLQMAKKNFAFTSNKLAYLSNKLCDVKKGDHKEFSGFSLWKECLAGNPRAWEEMEKYNKLDVLALEELFFKLAPWDSTINFNVYHDETFNICKCGSDAFVADGFHYTERGKYARYRCVECGTESRLGNNLLSKEKRNSLHKKVSNKE